MARSREAKTRPAKSVLVSVFGPCHVSTRGWYEFRCPFCDDQGQHFGIAPEGNGHCHRCGTNKSRLAVLRLIRARLRRAVESEPPEKQERRGRNVPDLSSTHPLAEELLACWHRVRPGDKDGVLTRKAVRYAKKRGVDLDLYEMGFFRADWLQDHMHSYLFWLFRQNGVPVYYQGRAILRNAKKTLNPPDHTGWFRKRDVLFFADHVEQGSEIVITEGPFDAVAATSGARVGVPLLGKSLSDRQLRLLCRKDPRAVYVLLDPPGKDPEIARTERSIGRKLMSVGLPAYFVRWPDKEKRDPSDLGTSRVSQMIDARSVRVTSLLARTRRQSGSPY